MIVGRTIKEIRPMTDKELHQQMWWFDNPHEGVTAIVLDDDTILYASRDEEGNGPGEMFGMSPGGMQFLLFSDGTVC